ncbi:MAG: TetR/AcrR family transcriptional regulator [Woeseiaceae bacterium]|nr:TetR/AcrR family transcriptional regulator [Woeseiaceae bacterium]
MLDSKNLKPKQHRAVLAAASVFAEKGYHGASTRDIADRMGIQQGSIYYYFKSKEDALADVCLFGIEDYVSHMETTAMSDQPFESKLLATITSHLTSYRERNEALKVHNSERLYLPKKKRTRLKALGSRYRQLLEELFEQGIADGVVRPTVDAHFAAQSVIGLCNAWGDLIVRDPGLDVFDAIQKCHDLLLNGLRGRPDTD